MSGSLNEYSEPARCKQNWSGQNVFSLRERSRRASHCADARREVAHTMSDKNCFFSLLPYPRLKGSVNRNFEALSRKRC
jgi:hypothetical protein